MMEKKIIKNKFNMYSFMCRTLDRPLYVCNFSCAYFIIIICLTVSAWCKFARDKTISYIERKLLLFAWLNI